MENSPVLNARRLLSIRYHLIQFTILFAGVCLYGYATRCGLNLTDDSLEYLRHASFYCHDEGMIKSTFDQMSYWPPLFGLIIYLWKLVMGIPLELLQLAFMLTNFFLLVTIGKRFVDNPAGRLIWLAVSFLGVSLIMVHVFLWSEPVFIAILLSLILVMDNFFVHKKIKWFLAGMMFSFLLCMQRNAGLFIIAALAFSILWYRPVKKWLLYSVILFLTGIASFLIWNLSISINLQDHHQFLRHSYFSGYFANTLDFMMVISAWFLPRLTGAYIRLIFILVIIIWVLWNDLSGMLHPGDYKPTVMLIVVCLFYIIGMSSIGRIDSWEAERYLSVIHPIFMLIFIKYAVKKVKSKQTAAFKWIAAFLIGIWISYSIARSGINVIHWHQRSCIGYNRNQIP
jgi:hypothetical protein